MPKKTSGRPKGSIKPLSGGDDRYWYMWLQAHIDCARIEGRSEIGVIETFVALRYGRLVPTRENFEAMARGEKFKVYTTKHSADPDSTGWRDKNHFRPIVDNERRKLRHKRDAKGPDGKWGSQWFAGMSWVALCCLQGLEESSRRLEFQAEKEGELELEYFNAKMRPILIERAKQRGAGLERADVPPMEIFRIFSFGNYLPKDETRKM